MTDEGTNEAVEQYLRSRRALGSWGNGMFSTEARMRIGMWLVACWGNVIPLALAPDFTSSRSSKGRMKKQCMQSFLTWLHQGRHSLVLH